MNVSSADFLKEAVSEIVRRDYRTADVFKRYGINYCCGGQVSVEEACRLRNLDLEALTGELDAATQNIMLPNTLQFNRWNANFLIDYIVNVHHAYISQALPALDSSLRSFVAGHSTKHAELNDIMEVFQELSALIQINDRYEEEIIFPYIKQIETAHRNNQRYSHLFVRTLRKPLDNIILEHNKISGLFATLRQLTNHYVFLERACTQHQVVYRKLNEFDKDMIQHKHLENNILFPKAIKIEKELLQL